MKDRETPRIRKYGESKTTRIMMATASHVTSGLADGFLLTRVYKIPNLHHSPYNNSAKSWFAENSLFLQCILSIQWGITVIADHTQNSTKFCSSVISISGSQRYQSAYLGTTGKCMYLNNKWHSWKHHIINYNKWITWKKPKISNYKSSNNVQ